jgi:hypothetical protein
MKSIYIVKYQRKYDDNYEEGHKINVQIGLAAGEIQVKENSMQIALVNGGIRTPVHSHIYALAMHIL